MSSLCRLSPNLVTNPEPVKHVAHVLAELSLNGPACPAQFIMLARVNTAGRGEDNSYR